MTRPSDGIRVMSDAQICRKYREADKAKKRYMVTVLAELNDCSKDDIVSVLYDNNELDTMAIGQYRRQGAITPKKSVTVKLPDDLVILVSAELDKMTKAVEDAKATIADYNASLDLVARYNRYIGYITEGITTKEIIKND